MRIDRGDDVFAVGQNGLNVLVQNEPEFFDRIEIVRIRHDDLESIVLV